MRRKAAAGGKKAWTARNGEGVASMGKSVEGKEAGIEVEGWMKGIGGTNGRAGRHGAKEEMGERVCGLCR